MKSLLLLFTIHVLPLFADSELVPRTVITLYKLDKEANETDLYFTTLHQAAEMPLNHLGFKLEYHDVGEKLPELSSRKDIAGILTWFNQGEKVSDQPRYLKWLLSQINSKRKLLILGEPGFDSSSPDIIVSSLSKLLWKQLGVKHHGQWLTPNSKSRLKVMDKNAYFFERKIVDYGGYNHIEPLNSDTTDILNMTTGDTIGSLAFYNSKGGHAAAGYIINNVTDDLHSIQWYLNPFYLFRKIYDADTTPKPDVTTASGRRVFFSHIDGDGWNNISHLKNKNGLPLTCTEVIYDRVIKAFPELPVTIGPVVYDITSEKLKSEKTIKMAGLILNSKNVEPATHTFSHPFDWSFFEDYTAEKENVFTEIYNERYEKYSPRSSSLNDILQNFFYGNETAHHHHYNDMYETPRAYALAPFSTEQETIGGCREIDKLLSGGKKTEVILLSGNCRPFEEFFKVCRENNIKVINGGDTRFDNIYPSHRWVSPIGKQTGKEIQIYAAASNENTYTELWTENFGGFSNLWQTIKRTESPVRLKPINVYYHIYSGEREASINAVVSNLKFSLKQNVCPLTTGRYIRTAKGFYSTRFVKCGETGWKIINRGGLQTIRFDNAALQCVDLEKSKGVLGQTYLQGSLYVALDSSCATPLVFLKENQEFWHHPKAAVPYLLDGNQLFRNLKKEQEGFSFTAEGFGNISCRWIVPEEGRYSVYCNGLKICESTTENRRLKVDIAEQAALINQISLRLKR